MDGKDAFSFAKTRGSGRKSRAASHAGCSFNIVFFEDFKIYSGLWPLLVSPRRQCVYTMAGQTPALQENLQSSENHNILRKTQYLMNTLYIRSMGIHRPKRCSSLKNCYFHPGPG